MVLKKHKIIELKSISSRVYRYQEMFTSKHGSFVFVLRFKLVPIKIPTGGGVVLRFCLLWTTRKKSKSQ